MYQVSIAGKVPVKVKAKRKKTIKAYTYWKTYKSAIPGGTPYRAPVHVKEHKQLYGKPVEKTVYKSGRFDIDITTGYQAREAITRLWPMHPRTDRLEESGYGSLHVHIKDPQDAVDNPYKYAEDGIMVGPEVTVDYPEDE